MQRIKSRASPGAARQQSEPIKCHLPSPTKLSHCRTVRTRTLRWCNGWMHSPIVVVPELSAYARGATGDFGWWLVVIRRAKGRYRRNKPIEKRRDFPLGWATTASKPKPGMGRWLGGEGSQRQTKAHWTKTSDRRGTKRLYRRWAVVYGGLERIERVVVWSSGRNFCYKPWPVS